jgi:hypothetical protein
MANRSDTLFDSNEAVDRTAWTKAMERYVAKGMSVAEIGKHRDAYRAKMAADKVKSLASKSTKK